MTAQEQRAKIAEHHGYRVKIRGGNTILIHPANAEICWEQGQKTLSDFHHYFPDYLNDRNAIHKAILTLNEKQYEEFCLRLCAGDKWREVELNIQDVKFAIKATVKQLADAFCETLDLKV